MGIKWKTVKNNFPKINRSLEILNGKKIQAGVFDGENAWLAGIHEYGCTITAKTKKYLTVPLSPKTKGKKASEFKDTFVITTRNNKKFIARYKNNKKDVELLYWLTESVVIPERSFLRTGYDENIDNIIKRAEMLINLVLSNRLSEYDFLNEVGQTLATAIKEYAVNVSPPNSSITQEVKGSSTPLSDTGALINSITWRID